MMKFTLLALAALFTVASAMPEISADSVLGKNLLTQARRVEENDNGEFDASWVAGYAVKFQGCHHIKQWNDNAEEGEDVKIATTRLIRFRLCPEDTCSSTKAAGCTKGYGDYIVDMDTFMESYFESKSQQIEYECEYQMNNVCDCGDDDQKGDDFNAEYCEYDCYVNAGMEECVDNNPYTDDEEGGEQFDIEDYMGCAQLDFQDDNERRRRLDEGEEEEAQYYVGPYCAKQGGSVYMGLFADDTCTEFAEVTFKSLAGFDLPYEGKSIIAETCMSCLEKNNDNDNQNDQQDADQVSESCEQMYTGSGKCEAKLPSGMVYDPNNNACAYMEGIRVVRQDGIIDTGSTRSSAVATSFIVVFAMAFAAMAFYVWYLRTRLGVKQNTLL
jgi:hypothetical protein